MVSIPILSLEIDHEIISLVILHFLRFMTGCQLQAKACGRGAG